MFQLQFHWYGFVVGLAAVIGYLLVEYQVKKRNISSDLLTQVTIWFFSGGIIGSRAWHVLTDFELYQNGLITVFAIWNGGLSIIGFLIGALVALWLFFYFNSVNKKDALLLLDLSVFGLPVAQAIGRVGNYINQELYGLPTNLFMGIYIEKSNRISGFEQFSYFHPLFAYEAILLLIFATVIWWRQANLPIGTGKIFLMYLMFYTWIRFGLDFLRIDKADSLINGLGFNQIVLLVVGIMLTCYLTFLKTTEQKRMI